MSTLGEPAPAAAANEFLVPTIGRPSNPRQRSSFKAPRAKFPPEHGSSKRRLLGLGLLSVVVVLWTTSGFLQSSIFADNTYSKPYFLTYINTAFFTLPLAPYLVARSLPRRTKRWIRLSLDPGKRIRYEPLHTDDDEESDAQQRPTEAARTTQREPLRGRTGADTPPNADYSSITHTSQRRASSLDKPRPPHPTPARPPLTLRETAGLSLRFCLLWYLANYTNAASLQFTSVASFTILSTTSSIFTLLFGAISGVEAFTTRKLLGVLACLAGVILTSSVEASGGTDTPGGEPGSFPRKSAREIVVGDALALASAVLYGLYCVLLVRTVGDESRIRMPVFFGFLGICNIALLWPGLLLLHYTQLEPFRLPQNASIWGVIVANAVSSLVSDLCWAYAVLFTSPLVVTVGLSLTIPLALVGQVVVQGVVVGAWYWVGAGVVVGSFVFVNHESSVEEKGGKGGGDGGGEVEDEAVV